MIGRYKVPIRSSTWLRYLSSDVGVIYKTGRLPAGRILRPSVDTEPRTLTERLMQRKECDMDVKRAGSQPSRNGPAEWFTGTVRIDPLFGAEAPSRALGISVTFEPGARTRWHSHPLGQNLVVTAGCGWAQRWGGPIEDIRPGDVVHILPGEKHWHGAAPTTAMTHIAVYEDLDGTSAEWMEPVSDGQYRK